MPATSSISIATTTAPAPAARNPKTAPGPSRFENELRRARPQPQTPPPADKRPKAPDVDGAAAPEPQAKNAGKVTAKDKKTKPVAPDASPVPADAGLMIDAPAEPSPAPDVAAVESEADSTTAVVSAADFIAVTYPDQPANAEEPAETQTISDTASSGTQPPIRPQAAPDLLPQAHAPEVPETEQSRPEASIADVPPQAAQADEPLDDTLGSIISAAPQALTEPAAMASDDAESPAAAPPRPAAPSSDVEQPERADSPNDVSEYQPDSVSTPRTASLPLAQDAVEPHDSLEKRESAPTAGSADKGRQPEPDRLQAPAPAHVKAEPAMSAQVERPAPPQPQTPVRTPEQQFIDDNHPQIVTSIRSQPLPNGSSMRIRLDPPDLGTMQVQIEMRDGMLAASFQTSTDDATRLLTHSLHQLKQALEIQGVNVDKLQVEQAPREKFAQSSHDQQQQQQRDEGRSPQQQQHEQQRREMLQRLWRRLRGGREPFDELA